MPVYGKVADEARDAIMAVLFDSDIRGKTGWEKKGALFHAYRALRHIGLFFIGDKTENHLMHALARLAMSYHLQSRGVSSLLSDTEFTGYGDDGG